MLRDYQKRAVADTYASMREHRSTMLQLPTGSGKTHVALEIIKHGLQHGRRINFCVDRLTLLDQTLDRLYREKIPFGVYQSGHPMINLNNPVQIVSLQTLQRRASRYWPPADLFIIDEAHTHYGITTKVMNTWNLVKFLGLSATPFTRGLARHWENLVVGATTAELMCKGYLSRYVAYGPSKPDLTGVRQSNGDYNTRDLEERMNVITGDIVNHYMKHAAGKKAIVFTPTVSYAERMADYFESVGVAADYVCGKDSDERRLDVLGRYREGKLRVICNVEVLTKGYDQPDIEVGIIARPTRSLSLHIQMLGRLLRVSPGIDRKLILDHAGNINRLGFPDDDLPAEMDDREKGVSRIDTRDQDEPQPWTCPQCALLVEPGNRTCPQCGFKPMRAAEVEVKQGSLKKMAKVGKVEKQDTYSQLLGYADQHGHKHGWVAHTYRDIFGVWPRGMIERKSEPEEKLVKWIRHRNIRFAKRREANG